MGGGASALPMDDSQNVYLTEDFRYAIGGNSLEVPGGGKDSSESVLEAAKRELEEETGITGDEWIDLGFVNVLTSVVFNPEQLYLVRKLHITQNRDEMEEKIIHKIPFHEAVQKVVKSEITHAPSCVLILKAARFIEKERV
ncbi:MAG: NUDIX hydrolase [Patescibacteria group bacterium]